MSSKFNGIRKLRNRTFHHEPVTWNLAAIKDYRDEIIETIDWFDNGLLDWTKELIRIDVIIEKRKSIIN